MKNGLKLNSLSAVVFALGLVLLVAIGPAGSEVREKGESEAGCSEYSTARFQLKCQPSGKAWLLTYRFQGSHDDWHEVSCWILREKSRDLEGSFGLREREWHAVKAQYFKEAILAAYPRRLYWGTVNVDPVSLGVQWVRVREALLPVEEVAAGDEMQAFHHWYADKVQVIYKTAEQRFWRDRGFVQHKQLGRIPDYPGLIDKSAAAMPDCASKLNEATDENPDLLMYFFQSMRFLEIDVVENGKDTGGLRLPCALMLTGEGDCDSKAATFCLIQRSHTRVVIFRSLPGPGYPKHALVGVDAYSSKPAVRAQEKSRRSPPAWVALEEKVYDEPILIDNVYYWPLEVAGGPEGSLQPLFKEVAFGHGGDYVPIPIPPSAR